MTEQARAGEGHSRRPGGGCGRRAKSDDGGELGRGKAGGPRTRPRRRPNAEAILPPGSGHGARVDRSCALWSAGESHYRGCVEAVGVRTRGTTPRSAGLPAKT